jgi:hypothetical protein
MGSVRTVVSATCLLILFSTLPVGAQTGVAPAALKTQIDQQMPELTTTYKQLHQYPELSHHEEKTSAYLAGEHLGTFYPPSRFASEQRDGLDCLRNDHYSCVPLRSSGGSQTNHAGERL